jgi:hypothetical protein
MKNQYYYLLHCSRFLDEQDAKKKDNKTKNE